MNYVQLTIPLTYEGKPAKATVILYQGALRPAWYVISLRSYAEDGRVLHDYNGITWSTRTERNMTETDRLKHKDKNLRQRLGEEACDTLLHDAWEQLKPAAGDEPCPGS